MGSLEHLPEDWKRALAVVAHPDDMEYGAASAVAKWTSAGKDVRYLLATRGEAGISSIDPDETARRRMLEQEESCRAVGVGVLDYLGHADGLVVEGLELRQDIAGSIRKHQPEIILSINHRESWGGPSWNHADHRAVGRSLLDAVRDAANPWVFPDSGAPWSGVRLVAFNGSPQATHLVELADADLRAGIASLECHSLYLENLDEPTDPESFLRGMASGAGEANGVSLATTFEVLTP